MEIKSLLKTMIHFMLIGGIGTVINIVVFNVLLYLGVAPSIDNLAGIGVGFVSNFTLALKTKLIKVKETKV